MKLKKKTRRDILKVSLGLPIGAGIGAMLADSDGGRVIPGGSDSEPDDGSAGADSGDKWLTIGIDQVYQIAADSGEAWNGITMKSGAALQISDGGTITLR